MAARATWKGHLKLSLVTIPIRVFPATDAHATISFNQLHEVCQTRIQQKKWCPHCEREVPNSEIVKGYEFSKGRYVTVSEEDLSKVRPESTRLINLTQFTTVDQIDPIYFDKTYFLAPDGDAAKRPYALLVEAMAKTGKVAIARFVMRTKQYLACIRPSSVFDKALVLETMYFPDEVRDPKDLDVPGKLKLEPRELKAAKFFPMTVFVDSSGKTAFVKAGEYTSAAELEADIDKYL